MTEQMQVRRRTRAVLGGVSDNLRSQIVHVFHLNKEMNAAKAAHDKARATLLALMDTEKQTNVSAETTLKDKKVELKAEVGSAPIVSVDVNELWGLVNKEQFLGMASVTKAAVVDAVGTAVFNKVAVSTSGKRNVTVSTNKG